MATTPPMGAMPPKLKTEDYNFNENAGAMQGAMAYKPDEEAMVSSQLDKLLAKDSPMMTAARTRAMQTANSRGLLNSSIAAGAGELAAIDSALPIATSDAQTNFTAQRDNNTNLNTFARDANTFGREGSMARFKGLLASEAQTGEQDFLDTQRQAKEKFTTSERLGGESANMAEITAQGANQMAVTNAQGANQIAQVEAQGINQLKVIGAQTEAQLKTLDAQNGTNLSTAYRNQMTTTYDTLAKDVQAIQESDMDPAVKDAQIKNLYTIAAGRQELVNTIFKSAPGWQEEWTQVATTYPGLAPTGG